MRKNIYPGIALLLLAAVLVAGLFLVDRYRHRFVQRRSDLVARLPRDNATMFFADIELLRQAGLLASLSSSHGPSEPDYQRFVHETGFDYSRDLDALAGSYRENQLALFLQGQFNWSHLRNYAGTHGGRCATVTCSLPGSRSDRWISFGELQPDVLAVFVSSDRDGASKLLTGVPLPAGQEISNNPLWLRPAHSLFQNPAALPLPLRIFALSLLSASSVVLSGTHSQQPGDAFTLRLEAQFPNNATADTARTQFDTNTKLLKAELTREHATPNSADLTGLVTSGVFQIVGNNLVAQWPVKRRLLQSLQ